MEDIVKVILYGAAILIWIIYKAREQRKSGMWKPRTGGQPVVETAEPPTIKRDPVKKPVKKTVTVKKPEPVYRAPSPVEKIKPAYDQEAIIVEAFETPFSKALENESLILFPPADQVVKTEEVFQFDLRQAVISAEILKRPSW